MCMNNANKNTKIFTIHLIIYIGIIKRKGLVNEY